MSESKQMSTELRERVAVLEGQLQDKIYDAQAMNRDLQAQLDYMKYEEDVFLGIVVRNESNVIASRSRDKLALNTTIEDIKKCIDTLLEIRQFYTRVSTRLEDWVVSGCDMNDSIKSRLSRTKQENFDKMKKQLWKVVDESHKWPGLAVWPDASSTVVIPKGLKKRHEEYSRDMERVVEETKQT